ncbi:MAG: hypothetical protein J6Z11_09300, partial [Candidatus Riflebacteria bacterium]|nr:hypothetical protein [Candidatus Riflebacteria bacterium]
IDDKVCIFHSGLKEISLEITEEIATTKAEINFININKPSNSTKNYLDFQLSTYLGYLIASTGNANIYIVTKDNGYNSVINFWKNKLNKTIIKLDSISSKQNSSKNTTKPKDNTKNKENTSNQKDKVIPNTNKQIEKSSLNDNSVQKEKTIVADNPPKQNNESKTEKSSKTQPLKAETKQKTKTEPKLSESWKNKIKKRLSERNIKIENQEYRTIYKAFLASKSTEKLLETLKHSLTKSKVTPAFDNLKDIFEEYLTTK